MIIYEGPSAIDGDPIVCILTGFTGTANPKTGQMIQSWILRQDMHPFEAIKSGEDYSICGNCVHRRDQSTGKRTCYVNPMGLGHIWKKYQRGGYPAVGRCEAARSLSGRSLRVGSYGDPAMLDFDLWSAIMTSTRGHTGYTHQWRWCDPRFADICMASVETDDEQAEAESLGYRVFRVNSVESTDSNFITCPASEEAGKRTTCDRCKLCSGNFKDRSARIPHVQITVHGSGAKHFKEGVEQSRGVLT